MLQLKFPVHLLKWSPSDDSPIWQVKEPPANLYIQGRRDSLKLLDRLPHDGFAIVGTREPQERSRAQVRRCVPQLKGSKLIILSGLARGIDAEAHTAAIGAGLPTIAVLGAGLDIPYPSENLELRQRILHSGGLVITEFAEGMEAQGFQFIRRNRLIAGWAQATWVVEASQRSGALNTAKWAREQDRTCFATPCFPGDPSLAGNQKLIDDHNAVPMWGAHSLGSVWIPLHAAGSGARQLTFGGLEENDERALCGQIAETDAKTGGISIEQLLEWALRLDWNPERFFGALDSALTHGRITEHHGVLAMSPSYNR